MRKYAIFDLDGTIISGRSSEVRFFEYLRELGEVSFPEYLRFLFAMFRHAGNWERMFYRNKAHYRGKAASRLSRLAAECFVPQMNVLISGQIRNIIDYHKKNGDLLILISGSLFFILEVFAEALAFDDCRGTGLEMEGDIITGNIEGVYPRDRGKIEVLKSFIDKYNIDMDRATMYANHFSDRHVLEMARYPVAVNPDKKLLRHARIHGWKIINT